MTLNLQPSSSLPQAQESASSSSSTFTAASTCLTSLSLTPADDHPHDQDAAVAIATTTIQAMPPPKPIPRAKVPLEKGYSQMVWLRLLQSEPDLAGLKGQSPKRLITMQEVKQHKTEEDAWTVLRGRVYNISPYIRFHPGGLQSS